MLVTVYCQRTPSKLCRAEGSSVSPPVWPSCGTLQHYLNGLLFYIPWILRPLQEPRIHWTFAECRQKGWTHGRVQKYPSPSSFQSIITHCCHWSASVWLFESFGYFSFMDSTSFARVPDTLNLCWMQAKRMDALPCPEIPRPPLLFKCCANVVLKYPKHVSFFAVPEWNKPLWFISNVYKKISFQLIKILYFALIRLKSLLRPCPVMQFLQSCAK